MVVIVPPIRGWALKMATNMFHQLAKCAALEQNLHIEIVEVEVVDWSDEKQPVINAILLADGDILRGGFSPIVALHPAIRMIDFQVSTISATSPDLTGVDMLMVELCTDADISDVLMDRIEEFASQSGRGLIVVFPVELLDLVSARVAAPSAVLLCAPQAADRMAAIGFALRRIAGVYEEKLGAKGEAEIARLAEEVARIAATLAGLADGGSMPWNRNADGGLKPGGDAFSDGLIGYRVQPSIPTIGRIHRPVSAAYIRSQIRHRRIRERYFDMDLFADPVWDMLLDLMAARIERRRVAVSSLCIAAAVPPTTALRAIRTMTDRGLLLRVADSTDKRRIFIELSDGAADAMGAYFSASAEIAAA